MTDRHKQPDDDAFAERVARPLRKAEHASNSFEDSLIAAIAANAPLPRLAPRRARPLSSMWWSSKSIHLTPIAGLAMAAGIAAIAAVIGRSSASPSTSPIAPTVTATAPVHDTVSLVRFVFVGPAKTVTLVGDFNGWGGKPMALDRAANGAWTTLVQLPSGRHEYAFIIDGERWVPDPLAPSSSDEFDTHSSVITVGI